MKSVHVHSPFAEDARLQPAPGPPPSAPVLGQYVVLGSAAATALLLGAAGIIATLQEGQLMSWWESTEVDNATLDLLYVVGSFTALTNLISFVATGLWLIGLRRVAEWAASGALQRRSSPWAFLGWVVPIVNLWFPYQVVTDSSRALGSVVKNFWPWWVAWLALNSYTVLNVSGGELATAQDLTLWIRTQQVGAVTAVIACILWWRVVRSATNAAAAAVAGVRVGS